jgi:hypothetical protein
LLVEREEDKMAQENRLDEEARRGLVLPRSAVRRLAEVGIFAKATVSLEHQHLAHRYVIRGIESGGAVEAIGHYVTFCDEIGEPLPWLHPLDSIGVNGVHAVVIAPSLVRVEMFRCGHTYDLLISRHAPGGIQNGRRPVLSSQVLFRAHDGYLGLDLLKEHKSQRGSVMPTFHSRGGEPLAIPTKFEAAVKAATCGCVCVGCAHSHYLRASEPQPTPLVEAGQ